MFNDDELLLLRGLVRDKLAELEKRATQGNIEGFTKDEFEFMLKKDRAVYEEILKKINVALEMVEELEVNT